MSYRINNIAAAMNCVELWAYESRKTIYAQDYDFIVVFDEYDRGPLQAHEIHPSNYKNYRFYAVQADTHVRIQPVDFQNLPC